MLKQAMAQIQDGDEGRQVDDGRQQSTMNLKAGKDDQPPEHARANCAVAGKNQPLNTEPKRRNELLSLVAEGACAMARESKIRKKFFSSGANAQNGRTQPEVGVVCSQHLSFYHKKGCGWVKHIAHSTLDLDQKILNSTAVAFQDSHCVEASKIIIPHLSSQMVAFQDSHCVEASKIIIPHLSSQMVAFQDSHCVDSSKIIVPYLCLHTVAFPDSHSVQASDLATSFLCIMWKH
ncbi:hypothetical protein DFJ58DRAFT_839679 [Suillus subalutaceus]|uniref:uncharacterized protein n=1 Tax=Suillus subalutaceus TaxID=48586 RepID=UPI001B8683B6|nr:uncharacterized protein DFJ58DRAFT_839679 [Suillus subalutaceus]KAG1861541.1 hypothetical protein DFJ58DRAFT_839679 [Suillus subalutaceus]